MSAAFEQTDLFDDPELIGGDLPRVRQSVKTVAGVYERGHVLGVVEATGYFRLSDAGAADGSEVPVAICAEDVDTTATQGFAQVFMAGQFRAARLKFGPGHDARSVTQSLWARGIHLTPYSGAE